MNEADLSPLKKLEGRNIVTSTEFDMDEQTDAQFTYLLDNILSGDEIQKILLSKRKSSQDSSRKSSGMKQYLENLKNNQFVKKYSSFSLMPDLKEDSKLDPDVSRIGTLENIISEEKFRRSDSEGFKMVTTDQSPQNVNQTAAFKRIKKKLDDMRRYCPTLYYAEDDIFTIWGNMNLNVNNK